MEKALIAFIVLAAVWILIAMACRRLKKGSCDDCRGCSTCERNHSCGVGKDEQR